MFRSTVVTSTAVHTHSRTSLRKKNRKGSVSSVSSNSSKSSISSKKKKNKKSRKGRRRQFKLKTQANGSTTDAKKDPTLFPTTDDPSSVEIKIVDKPPAAPHDPAPCDCMTYTVCFAMLLPILSLILEGYAFNHDLEWNKIVSRDAPFPSLTTIHYFNDKKLLLNPADKRNEGLRGALLRDEYYEPAALAFISITLAAVGLALALYLQGEAHRNIVAGAHLLGSLFMLIAAICIFVSDGRIDTAHLSAAAFLEKHLDSLTEQVNSPKPEYGMNLLEEGILQTMNFIVIERICALGASHAGRFSGSTNEHYTFILIDKQNLKRITLEDLRDLKFCSLVSYKVSAAILAICYSVFCFCIPILARCMDTRKLKIVPEEGKLEEEQMKKKIYPKVDYGYDYSTVGEQFKRPLKRGSTEEVYDPSIPPAMPLIPLDLLLELEYAQLASLHDEAVGEAGGTSDEDEFSSIVAKSSKGSTARGGRSPSPKKIKKKEEKGIAVTSRSEDTIADDKPQDDGGGGNQDQDYSKGGRLKSAPSNRIREGDSCMDESRNQT